jgi:hypothetical protein
VTVQRNGTDSSKRLSTEPIFRSIPPILESPPTLQYEPPMPFVKEGTVVIILGSESELDLASKLACGFAQSQFLHLIVYDYSFVNYSSPLDESCVIDVISISTDVKWDKLLEVQLEKIGKIDLAIYTKGDDREARTFRVLERTRRRFKSVPLDEVDDTVSMEREMVIFGLNLAELPHAEWISSLSIESLRHWHTPRIDISVITNNRPRSLQRLLASLDQADYYGDSATLTINLEQTTDYDTQALVDGFKWQRGELNLRKRIVLGGLMPAIVESWYPASNDSYGILLEDDIEVSPQFYAWCKMNLLYALLSGISVRAVVDVNDGK